MPRNGSVKDLQWFRGEASYVFHPMNAYSTADGKIVCDVCEYPQAPLFPNVDGTSGDPKKALAKLARWTFDLRAETDRYQVEQLDDLVCEFPRLDERYAGLHYRYGYIAGDSQPPDKLGGFNVIAAVDHSTGRWTATMWVQDAQPVNPFLYPAQQPPRRRGFLLAYVYDANRSASHWSCWTHKMSVTVR